MNFAELLLYWNSVRHMRPEQILARLRAKFFPIKISITSCPPVSHIEGKWLMPPLKESFMIGPRRFNIYGIEIDLDRPNGWVAPKIDRLRHYNLHYFSDLIANGWPSRALWHESLIDDWIEQNPPGKGIGWEPYPVSIRITNLIKWDLAGGRLTERALQSLAFQTRYLGKCLEFGHLGNHLLANAKALIFSGAFFEGKEPRSWLIRGLRLLEKELRRQILKDGGHFEGSPMYHALVLEDLLDILNLEQTFPQTMGVFTYRTREFVQMTAREMHRWLKVMTHPDGQIALFNDAAFGVSHPLAALEDYAAQLKLEFKREAFSDGIFALPESGYVRLQSGDVVAIADGGPIGPDYMPGHGHADTLSFEVSYQGQRVIVDSGTSLYGPGEERIRQRGTSAHNTVTVDGHSSSEVWGDFRVARRARPFGFHTSEKDGKLFFSCGHDGYRKLHGRPLHRRYFTLSGSDLRIIDKIEGNGSHSLTATVHFHPSVDVVEGNKHFMIRHQVCDKALEINFEGAEARLKPSTYHPRFGESKPSYKIILTKSGQIPTRFITRITFGSQKT